jgi:hypothetical protein
VELHTELTGTEEPGVAWRRMAETATEGRWQGHSVRLPSATEMLWHGLVHAEPRDLAAWRLRLLLDAAAPLAGPEPIDWPAIEARLGAGEMPDVGAARRWLDAAAQLAGVTIPGEAAATVTRFDVARALRWRLAVLAKRQDKGLGARLLEEGTRVELGRPLARAEAGSGALKRLRRQLGGRAARGIYHRWRARDAREGQRR